MRDAPAPNRLQRGMDFTIADEETWLSFQSVMTWHEMCASPRVRRRGRSSKRKPYFSSAMLNANPTLFEVTEERRVADDLTREHDLDERDPLDNLEVFDMIRSIKDPEHPHTLEQLRVAQSSLIQVDDKRGLVSVNFTPTIPHCSMATLIGLCIRVKLLRSLPPRFKVDVNVTPGTHASEAAVNKQLNDKERVAAALENDNLLRTVNQCCDPSTLDS